MNVELLQDVIDRLTPGYPSHELFEAKLRAFISDFPLDNPYHEKNGVRIYCETKAIADASTENERK